MLEAIETKKVKGTVHVLYVLPNDNFRIGTTAVGAENEVLGPEVSEDEVLKGVFDDGIEFDYITDKILCSQIF